MAAGRAMGWVALLDEKKTRRTRDFTLLVGSSFFVSRAQPTPPGDRSAIAASSAQLPALCAQAGGRKCIVRAATAEELLLAVLAALEVHTTACKRLSRWTAFSHRWRCLSVARGTHPAGVDAGTAASP